MYVFYFLVYNFGDMLNSSKIALFSRRVFKIFQKSYLFNHNKYSYEMNKVYIRQNPEENKLQINFKYKNDEYNLDREFNFSRTINENISVCLDRIKNNVEKELSKKFKKKKRKTPNDIKNNEDIIIPTILIQLLQHDEPVNTDEKLSSLLENTNGENLALRILDVKFDIEYNKPWVSTLSLPAVILAGYYLYPSKIEMQYATRENSKGSWFKGRVPNTETDWEPIGEGLIYCTKNDDIGYYIKFELQPGNEQFFGPPIEIISKNSVEAGPGTCPFETRHLFTKSELNNKNFRVVSYNLLADYYADSDYSRKELFPYCPPYALNIDYRKQLFTKEIIGYNADIICLQELDSKVFELDLAPVLANKYEGILQKKGTTPEGICVFYKTKRFELLRKMAINIGENISKLDAFNSLYLKILNNQPLLERATDRATTLQVVVLKSKDTGNYLIVANTHLYFHPDADHIRLLQIGFSMLYVNNVYEEVLETYGLTPEKLSILFCGDFNSVPECGIFKLMTENHVDENFIDWSSNKEQAVTGVALNQPFEFGSACGTPNYTNYTHLFSGCLDYIFYQRNNLDVDQIIPLPSDEEIKAHKAIPSVVFPSDHIALVADLKWKSSNS